MRSVLQHPGKLITIGLTTAIASLALLPGTWSAALAQTAGTPPPAEEETTSTATVEAGEAATLQLAADVVLRIPAGALSEDATLTYQPIFDSTGEQVATAEVFAQLNVPAPEEVESGDAVVVTIFNLEAVDAAGNPISLEEPVTLEIELTPEFLALAGGDPDNISLQFYDESTDSWASVACSATANELSCQLPHFSVWSLVIQTGTSAPDASTPDTSTPGDTSSPEDSSPDTASPNEVPAPADTGMGLSSDEAGANVALLLGIGAAVVLIAGGLGFLKTRAAQRR